MASSRRFGNYEILERLEGDRVREIHRARVLTGNRAGTHVALMQLAQGLTNDSAYASLFLEDAERSMSLEHPALANVLDAGRVGNVPYAVTEALEGRALSAILAQCWERRVLLPPDFAMYIVHGVLEGLAHAHREGLVHGDLAVARVFLTTLGEVKLLEFGWAGLRAALTSAGVLAPRHFYASPDLLDGTLGPEADLWAANVILYELLTLEHPFEGEKPQEIHHAIRERVYQSIRALRPEVPRAIEALVDRGFSAAEGDRFGSAEEFAKEVSELFDQSVGTPLGIAAVVRGLFQKGLDDPYDGPTLVQSSARASTKAPPNAEPYDAPTIVQPLELATRAPPPPVSSRKPTVESAPAKRPHATPDPSRKSTVEGAPAAKPPPPPPVPPLGKPHHVLGAPAAKAPPPPPVPPPGKSRPVEGAVGNILGSEAKFQRGMALLEKRSFKAAHRAFAEAVELFAEEAELHAYLGWSAFLANAKNAEVALGALGMASALNPKLDKTYLFRGIIRAAKGQTDAAREDLEKALQCNPDCEQAERELRKLNKAKR